MQEQDGRRLRAERSRERVLEAVLDLVSESSMAPTAQQVADRSGVSIRSVFRLYDDVQELHAAALEVHVRRVLPLYELPSAGGSTADRVRRIVAARARLFEAVTPARRLGVRLAARSPVVASQLDRANRVLSAQLGEFFAADLDGRAAAERRVLLQALDLALSWETWERLRTVQGLPDRAARQTLALLARSLLAAPAD